MKELHPNILAYTGNDEQLLHLIQNAEETIAYEAFRTLWERYENLIQFVIRQKVPTVDVESVFSNTFYKVFNNFRQTRWETVRKAKNWIIKIAQNEIVDYYAESERYVKMKEDYSSDPSVRNIRSDPFYDRARQEGIKVIEGMSDDYRQVGIMFFKDGLTAKQIADKLGIRVGTVNSRLAKVREKLKGVAGSLDDY